MTFLANQSDANVRLFADALALVTDEILANARKTHQFTKLRYHVSFGENGGLSGSGTPRPDPGDAVRFMRPDIITMRSYLDVSDVVANLGGFRALLGNYLDPTLPPADASNSEELLPFVITFVLSYIETVPTATWRRERFDDLFAQLMIDLSRRTVVHRITAYLIDVEVMAELRLSDVGTIRPVSERDIEVLWDRSAASPGLAFGHEKAALARSVLELSFELDHGNLFGMGGHLLESHLNCLRLTIGSRGLFAIADEQIRSPLYSRHAQTIWSADLPVLFRGSRAINILREESLPEFRACMTAISSSVNRSSIELALRRLASGGSRDRDEDSFLDYVIGIESILGDPGDIGYRIALRLAVAIGTDSADRLAIFRNFKKIYKRRSTIAHGQSPSVNTAKAIAGAEDLRRANAEVADYLRRLVLRLLLAPAEASKDTIDEGILLSATL